MRHGWLVLCLWACGVASSHDVTLKQPDAMTPPPMPVSDSDHDGVCDATEQQVGTDPHAADSDGDGLPDLIELANGFNPIDAANPAPDQLGQLEARAGASLDFPVRATVEGDGQGVSGLFQAISALYGDGVSAEDFFAGASAVSADPSDAVRNIDTTGAHFDSVLGHTRLVFSLHFEYAGSANAPSCGKAYPFRYSVKSDDGSTAADRVFLLILTAEGETGGHVTYCQPRGCQ